jgi:omega-hydroxy-beta-dihydromenaquinone-9 sulfotransferase
MTVRPRPPRGARPRPAARKGANWRHPFRIARQGEGLAYVWHGMRFGTWIRLLAEGRFDITFNCAPRILAVTLTAPLISAVSLLSEAAYGRRAAATAIQPPVFILGHWRTGTTLVHDLLACDPTLAYPTTHQCLFANTFLVSGRGLNRIYELFMPARRPFDDMPMGLDRPQEEEFGLVTMGVGSLYRGLAFPRHGPPDLRFLDLDGLADEQRRDWEAAYVRLLKRLQFAQQRPLVLKSPPNTARLKTLTRLFPDARYIHIARDPFEVYPSTVRMLRALMSVQGLQNPPMIDGWLEEYVLAAFERMFAAYERDRRLVPEGRLVEVRFEDLVADPKGVVADLYGRLGIGDFAAAEPAIDAYLAERAGHRRNAHRLDAATRGAIVERWRPYFERFGYATG